MWKGKKLKCRHVTVENCRTLALARLAGEKPHVGFWPYRVRAARVAALICALLGLYHRFTVVPSSLEKVEPTADADNFSFD